VNYWTKEECLPKIAKVYRFQQLWDMDRMGRLFITEHKVRIPPKLELNPCSCLIQEVSIWTEQLILLELFVLGHQPTSKGLIIQGFCKEISKYRNLFGQKTTS